MEITTLLLILILIISLVSLVIALSLNSRLNKLEQNQEAIPRQVAELMASKILKQIRIIEKEIPSQKLSEEKDHQQPSAEKFRIVSPADEEQPIQKNELQHQVDEHTVAEKKKPPSTDTTTKKFDKYSVPSIKSDEEINDKNEYRWK
jgi:Na+-transporting NADH:ubiquinone oxidoreductase subunit NqrC